MLIVITIICNWQFIPKTELNEDMEKLINYIIYLERILNQKWWTDYT